MELHDQIAALAQRLPSLQGSLQTEEATKHALVLPFIAALGYNVFDPAQVVPEYVASVAGLKGEKVDYVLMRDGVPAVLIECKQANTELLDRHLAQISRYFTRTPAKIGILTNGIVYRFFTDLAEPNLMDNEPFLVLDLRQLDADAVKELHRITHDRLDLDGMVEAARELSYLNGMQAALARQLTEPDDELVQWLARQVYKGRLTESVRAEFAERTKNAFRSLINDRVNELVKRAAEFQRADTTTDDDDDLEEHAPDVTDEDDLDPGDKDDGIVTTVEEMEALDLIRAILADTVSADRVVMRDNKAYCAILLDDNNRKPLIRLRFGKRKKVIGLFDAEKKETKHPISSINELYRYHDELCETAARYDENRADDD